MLEPKLFTGKRLDIHQPNTLTKCGRKCIEDIHCRGDPFCEPIVAIPGLVKCGDLLSKDSEDSFGGITGLKDGEERMLGQVFLSSSFV